MISFSDVLKILGIFGIFGMIGMMSAVGIDSGLIPTSNGAGESHAESAFSLKVRSTGETTYEGVEAIHSAGMNVAEEVREEIISTVYPSPDAAIEAVEGKLPGNPAYAHAVYVCWHQTYGKESLNTGGGRHWTFWRKDYQGYRYTTTRHQVYSNGWVTYATYKIRTNLKYC